MRESKHGSLEPLHRGVSSFTMGFANFVFPGQSNARNSLTDGGCPTIHGRICHMIAVPHLQQRFLLSINPTLYNTQVDRETCEAVYQGVSKGRNDPRVSVHILKTLNDFLKVRLLICFFFRVLANHCFSFLLCSVPWTLQLLLLVSINAYRQLFRGTVQLCQP